MTPRALLAALRAGGAVVRRDGERPRLDLARAHVTMELREGLAEHRAGLRVLVDAGASLAWAISDEWLTDYDRVFMYAVVSGVDPRRAAARAERRLRARVASVIEHELVRMTLRALPGTRIVAVHPPSDDTTPMASAPPNRAAPLGDRIATSATIESGHPDDDRPREPIDVERVAEDGQGVRPGAGIAESGSGLTTLATPASGMPRPDVPASILDVQATPLPNGVVSATSHRGAP